MDLEKPKKVQKTIVLDPGQKLEWLNLIKSQQIAELRVDLFMARAAKGAKILQVNPSTGVIVVEEDTPEEQKEPRPNNGVKV